MPRRGGPTLLELASGGSRTPTWGEGREERPKRERKVRFRRERSEKPPKPKPEPEPDLDDGPSLPRAVRVPMGYIFVAGALVVVLVVGGYLVGYRRADSALRDRERLLAQRELESAVQDPLLEDAPVNPQLLPNAGASPETTSGTNATNEPRQPERQAPAREVAPGADPRIPGLNYFIVAYTSPEEAQEAVDFLAANGVNAAVFETRDDRFRHVIALRGFTSEEMKAGEHESFKARLQSLGRIWERDHGGSANWADTYPAKYSG